MSGVTVDDDADIDRGRDVPGAVQDFGLGKQPEVGFAQMRCREAAAGQNYGVETHSLRDLSRQYVIHAGDDRHAMGTYQRMDSFRHRRIVPFT